MSGSEHMRQAARVNTYHSRAGCLSVCSRRVFAV